MWPFRKRRKTTRSHPRFLRARFDAAQTTAENARHWAMSDGLSADASMTPEVRRTLRNRSRYEVANNSYAKGLVLTVAGDCVGTGPRLQLQSEDPETNRSVEQSFAQWAQAIDLPTKLRAMRMAKATDGEAFAMLTSNSSVDHSVKLDVQLIEAERVTVPVTELISSSVVDGIEFDADGNPVAYHVLNDHPGNTSFFYGGSERIPAEAMIHWFRADRPEQHRGVPEITPALPLFAQLRRYTLAVLAAAETAADFAAVLYTDSPAGGEAQPVDPLDVIELEKRMATTLPDGWKLGQIKAEHPSTTFFEFRREILAEIGRCLLVPVNVITGDSSRHNYASGRLDHQGYHRSLRIEQSHLGHVVMDQIFKAWLHEAQLVYLTTPTRGKSAFQKQWFWDGNEHVDPAKEANAQATRLASLTTTLAAEYARQGKDWETELRQVATERQLLDELGLTTEVAQQPDTENDSDDEEDDDSGKTSKEES